MISTKGKCNIRRVTFSYFLIIFTISNEIVDDLRNIFSSTSANRKAEAIFNTTRILCVIVELYVLFYLLLSILHCRSLMKSGKEKSRDGLKPIARADFGQ